MHQARAASAAVRERDRRSSASSAARSPSPRGDRGDERGLRVEVARLGLEHLLRGLLRGGAGREQAVVGEQVGEVVGRLDDRAPQRLVARRQRRRARRRGRSRRRTRRSSAATCSGARAGRGEPRDVDADPAARLDDRAQQLGPGAAVAGERHVREQVEPAVGAPVAHARRAAVADLDEPGLLEALERLADGVAVHGERLGEQALGRQRVAGRVAPARIAARSWSNTASETGRRAIGSCCMANRITDWTSCVRSALVATSLGGDAEPSQASPRPPRPRHRRRRHDRHERRGRRAPGARRGGARRRRCPGSPATRASRRRRSPTSRART